MLGAAAVGVVSLTAGCQAITGGSGNAYARVTGTIVGAADSLPARGVSLALICTVYGRGSFGDTATTDVDGRYEINLDVPPRYMDDVEFTHWQMPCDVFKPPSEQPGPSTLTKDIKFAASRADAPVTVIDLVN